MSWSDLPTDMVEEIFSHLSLLDSARISSTCYSFRELYGTRMVAEQGARCDLVIQAFGHARIQCLVDLLATYMRGDSLHAAWVSGRRNMFSVSADGALVPNPWAWRAFQRGDGGLAADGQASFTGMRVAIWPYQYITADGKGNADRICIETPGWAWGYLSVSISQAKRIMIDMNPHDADLKLVALLQAMLSQGLAQLMRDAGRYAVVDIQPLPESAVLKEWGLSAQILPLMPFVSRYTPWRKEGYFRRLRLELLGSAQGGAFADEGTATGLDEGSVSATAPHAAIRPVGREGCVTGVFRCCTWLLGKLRCGVDTHQATH
jgi:hypothetical protein